MRKSQYVWNKSMLWSIDTCQNKVSADQYHVTILRDQVYRSSVWCEVDRWPSANLWIGSRAHVWLTCWKQGRIVLKPVNAHPELKGHQIIIFSPFQMFLLVCFVYMVKLKTEGQTLYRSIQLYRLLNSNQNSTFSSVSLIRLWTTRLRSYAFRLA